MPLIHSFDPVIDENSRVLLLGSMPGRVSLEKRQYYAHPLNQFWDIVYSIFEMRPDKRYEDKIAFLKLHKIALWDVIRECERSGSADSRITNPVMNDFSHLLGQFPHIKFILFNGNTTRQLFQRHKKTFNTDQVGLIGLPSSSPAHARIKMNGKLAKWMVIKDLVTADF